MLYIAPALSSVSVMRSSVEYLSIKRQRPSPELYGIAILPFPPSLLEILHLLSRSRPRQIDSPEQSNKHMVLPTRETR